MYVVTLRHCCHIVSALCTVPHGYLKTTGYIHHALREGRAEGVKGARSPILPKGSQGSKAGTGRGVQNVTERDCAIRNKLLQNINLLIKC